MKLHLIISAALAVLSTAPGAVSAAVAYPVSGFENDGDGITAPDEFESEDEPMVLAVRCKRMGRKRCRRARRCRWKKYRGVRVWDDSVMGSCKPRHVVVKDLGYEGDEDEEFDFFDEE